MTGCQLENWAEFHWSEEQRLGYFKKNKNVANDNEKSVSKTKHAIVLNLYIQNHYCAQTVTRDYFLLAT